MGKIKYLFCEGSAGSLDSRLLDKVLRELPAYPEVPVIVPTGGKGNIPNFMNGYLDRKGVRKISERTAIGFRDRDFDAQVPESCSLTVSRNPDIYLSYYPSVESYLLSPELFFLFLQERNLSEAVAISSISEAQGLFVQTAQSLKFYSAARYALGELRDPKIGWRTSWVNEDGKLPNSLEKEHCISEAKGLILHSKTKVDIALAEFEEKYNAALSRFNDNFFETQQYRAWIHGKNFAEAIRTNPKISNSNFSLDSFFQFALNHFNFTDFPDLVELFELLKQPE
jgi:hypothetical protein